MSDTGELVKRSDYSAKIAEVGGQIPSITCLATTAAPNAVENNIFSFSDVVKKTDYKTKISDI